MLAYWAVRNSKCPFIKVSSINPTWQEIPGKCEYLKGLLHKEILTELFLPQNLGHQRLSKKIIILNNFSLQWTTYPFLYKIKKSHSSTSLPQYVCSAVFFTAMLPPVTDKCSTLSVVENVHTVRKFQIYGSFAHYWRIYYTYQEQSSTQPLTPTAVLLQEIFSI